MDILGYSERGAMNALFYGIALNNDIESMKKFMELANIEGDYTDFKVYSEFSLSDFGDPDMVIIADKNEGGKEVFFIEAKVSCGSCFDLSAQYGKHNNYINQDSYKSGNSSNLFFQLRQKYYFFETKGCKEKQYAFDIPNLIKYYNQEKTEVRRTGSNPVVKKFMELISVCTSAHYIAIVPENASSEIDAKNKYGFDIHFVIWKDLKESFGKYLDKTILFNQEDNYDQILNNK